MSVWSPRTDNVLIRRGSPFAMVPLLGGGAADGGLIIDDGGDGGGGGSLAATFIGGADGGLAP